MAVKMPIAQFVAELEAALNRKDGYIMGAKGQDPKKWSLNSWFFTQYKDRDEYTEEQEKKALYWRKHAQRVWDCNGLPEGIYEDYTDVNINTKARYNYSGWCGKKGTGTVPLKYRKAGTAVFWGKKASSITHVAYLYKPVKANKPEGDWYILEARGVLHGVVMTKMNSRKPNFWGIMDKYFDYGDADYVPAEPKLGEVILKNGMMDRADVKEMQTNLIALGYDLGRYGADGDFGDTTELALIAFQRDAKIDADGEYGPISHAAMMKALEALKPAENAKKVRIEGGDCWIRTAPNKSGKQLGVAKEGNVFEYQGQTSENGWLLIAYKNQNAWVSGKYGKLE